MLITRKSIFYLLIITIGLYQTAHAQSARKVNKQKKYHSLQVVDGNVHYEFSVLAISKKKPTHEATYTWYLNNAIKSTQGNFNGKLLEGTCSKYDNKTNVLIAKGSYKQGQKNGEWYEWDEGGKLKSLIAFRHGLRNGLSTEYDESGKITEKKQYKKDVLHGKSYTYIKGIEQKPVKYKKGIAKEKKQKTIKQKEAKTTNTEPIEQANEKQVKKEEKKMVRAEEKRIKQEKKKQLDKPSEENLNQ